MLTRTTRIVLATSLLLAACSPASAPPPIAGATVAETSLPPVKSFRAAAAAPTERANSDIARDFLDLSFALESGRNLPVLTRFDEPITVKLTGRNTPILRNDLAQLLARLRTEAKIDIRQVSEGRASITIEAVAKRDIRRALPHAACFVVPNVSSLAEYRRARGAARTDWAALRSREQLAIFLPYDTSPQDMRDCLHEELAQAIGPLNDLYRLDDSVFNDDNFHAVLTGFDMLILRAYYDPMLANGMTRTQVAARLPAILSRLNPGGDARPVRLRGETSRAWIDAIQNALGPSGTGGKRLSHATRALSIAQTAGWNDHRLAFSHYALARLYQGQDGARSNHHYRAAARAFETSAPAGPHLAIVSTQLAAYALSDNKPGDALTLIEASLPAAYEYENAVQLASLLMLKSEALSALGRETEADAARLDSLGWARYGFGPDWAVRAKLREVASLNPKNRSF
ncbi:DUF2927 domain-containing protein [Cognatishimia sp. SS12]|uniref:DUF2927 domain-containing protein n=1 Tax=Cognatishimia sp. SS12 TaxID=2979465 RepID=UPI00232FF5DA|nr:DUF2927 domain-containing protein [Cognatishimia sp. SS12]MDC0737357.1 DUF2927 domain-containing protein [Cognatishimia sp. SS12]